MINECVGVSHISGSVVRQPDVRSALLLTHLVSTVSCAQDLHPLKTRMLFLEAARYSIFMGLQEYVIRFRGLQAYLARTQCLLLEMA